MDLQEFADKLGISYKTAYRRYKSGMIPGAKQFVKNGKVFIPDDVVDTLLSENTGGISSSVVEIERPLRAVTYARVSSSDQRTTNLVYQSKRLNEFCEANGWVLVDSVSEVGSGLNDGRPKLTKLLCRTDYDLLVVEHKDRLTRFGFKYLEIIASLQNFKIVVVNSVEDNEGEEDIIQDLVSIVTSMCARIYGRRRSKRKTEKIIQELKDKE